MKPNSKKVKQIAKSVMQYTPEMTTQGLHRSHKSNQLKKLLNSIDTYNRKDKNFKIVCKWIQKNVARIQSYGRVKFIDNGYFLNGRYGL